MLPFLSLITGKSDNQQLCALSSPSFLLTTLPRFKVRTVAETQREFPLWRNFTFPNCGLLCPTQHTRAGRVALKTYARSRCSYRQCHITGPLWFYILSIVSAFHLGQWHNGADKKRLKGATWTIWTTPFGVLTLWPSWSLHKDPPVPFFFLKITLAIQGFLYFHTNCEIICSSSVKNAVGSLIGIALNL